MAFILMKSQNARGTLIELLVIFNLIFLQPLELIETMETSKKLLLPKKEKRQLNKYNSMLGKTFIYPFSKDLKAKGDQTTFHKFYKKTKHFNAKQEILKEKQIEGFLKVKEDKVNKMLRVETPSTIFGTDPHFLASTSR